VGIPEHDRTLDREDLADDPIEQFERWFAEAEAADIPLANAIALATADAAGRPSVRHVLLRGVGPDGFTFFTNRGSRKGRQLAENPSAAIVVLWKELDRQVSATGTVTQLEDAASDAYFATRPREAQLGAWASRQSEVLPDRAALEAAVEEAAGRFGDEPVPRPPTWGGYRLAPDALEFWQGRPFRLHDRFRYERDPAGGWRIDRLAP
jgi:pyridoxamine 5'-phosphate oxidase